MSRLPSNATLEECERYAYVEGDLEKVELFQKIQELEEYFPSCGRIALGWGSNYD